VTDAREDLSRGAYRVLGRPLNEAERAIFSNYLILLVKWQKSQRLIGSGKPAWIVENLFLDSLLFLKVLPASFRSLLDLGSGAGIPGIPIKIVRPEVRLVLVESRQRRASFLSSAVRDLGLLDTRVVGGRVEEHMDDLSSRFDAVVMRCAGDLERLMPTAAELVSPGGTVVAAGSPTPRPVSIGGEWVTVEGHSPGRTRRFLVYRRP
jgi:16S rRNA (guanine527-N7)-methyltransferase